MKKVLLLLAAAGLSAFAASASAAEDAWSDIRAQAYVDRAITPAESLIFLQTPYRSANDLRTPLGAEVQAPDGAMIRSVTLIIDNNPMPVSAVFEMAEPTDAFSFSTEMRMNGPSPVRVLLETDAGELYMAETFVKTSGTGACAAAPVNDPAVALETLGQMDLAFVEPPLTNAAFSPRNAAADDERAPAPRARLSIRHPSNSGLQMDQISLLYITARYIEKVEVSAGDRPLFTMTGSISLSEDPALVFELPSYAETLTVRMLDTDDAEVEHVFPVVNN